MGNATHMSRATLWSRPLEVPEVASGATTLSGAYDTVVVGGGLTGLVTALLLARGGQSVLVVEADRLGGVTTRRSSAKITALQGTKLSSVAQKHPREVVEAYVAANLEGLDWLRGFCADHDVTHRSRTAYTYATTAEGREQVLDEYRVAGATGLGVRLDSDVDLPFSVTAAVALDDQVEVDPVSLTDALVAECRRVGVEMVEGVRVRRVRGRGPFRVVAGRGDAEGEARTNHVVLATNHPLVDHAGLFAWFSPHRSHVLAYNGEAPDGMFISVEQPTHSIRGAELDGQPYLLVGGHGFTTGRTDSSVAHADGLAGWAREHFGDRGEVARWSAQDWTPADAVPWMGPVLPGVNGLLAAGGYDKWGFTSAVAAGSALAGRLLGVQVSWADLLWVGRAKVRGLPSAARNGAESGVEVGRGVVRAVRTAAKDSGICTHLGGVVRWNDLEESWDCPLHGSRFERDGDVLEGPATCGLRKLRRG